MSAIGVGSSIGVETLRSVWNCDELLLAVGGQSHVEMRLGFALFSVDDAPRKDAYISHLGRLLRMCARSCESGMVQQETWSVEEEVDDMAKGRNHQSNRLVLTWKLRNIKLELCICDIGTAIMNSNLPRHGDT